MGFSKTVIINRIKAKLLAASLLPENSSDRYVQVDILEPPVTCIPGLVDSFKVVEVLPEKFVRRLVKVKLEVRQKSWKLSFIFRFAKNRALVFMLYYPFEVYTAGAKTTVSGNYFDKKLIEAFKDLRPLITAEYFVPEEHGKVLKGTFESLENFYFEVILLKLT